MLKISRELLHGFKGIALSNIARTTTNHSVKNFHTNLVLNCEKSSVNDSDKDNQKQATSADEDRITSGKGKRVELIPVETSLRYMKSAAYKQTYGEQFVWEQYRRNHKGLFAPRKTRKTCIRAGVISTGNPCPICRDEYLVLDHRNLDLLRQFISPQSGQVLSYSKTGLCQKRHLELLVAVERAWDYGLLEYDVPFREYDYSEYYGEKVAKALAELEKH